ncbi:MAG: ABC transporter permease [Chloroflexi bacterium]|nr:ABC transporter permease [Chloroflexota bacterium]
MRAANALARRSLVARPLRTGLTVVGIALGVGVLVAALIVNAALDTAVDRSVRDLLGRADLRVAAFEEQGLSAATVLTVAMTPGIATVAPTLERRTYPLPAAAATTLPAPVTVVGIERAADPAIHDRPLSAGSPLGTGDEQGALVSADLAREDGLEVGATITLLGDPAVPPTEFEVVGILAPTPGDPDPAGRSVVVPLAAAQALFATDRVTAVDVLLADGTDATAAAAALEWRLTSEPYTLSTPADVAAALEASTAEIRIAIALVAAVALFGGAFLIFNTLSMTVAERARDVGLLRAAGMTRRQVTSMVLLSAAHLGVAGVAIGVLVGIVLAAGAVVLLGGGGGGSLDELSLPPGALLLGAVLGFLVTLAAAVEPALRAARISPVAALRLRLDQGAVLRARLRWLLLVFAVVGLVGLALWPGVVTGRPGLVRPLAVFAILLGIALVAPFVAGPLGRAVGLLAAPFLPAEERLTRGSLTRDRSRTALTVGALAVSLAVLVALAGVAGSTREAATAWLEEVIPGELLLTSIRPVGADEPAAAEIAALPGVARVSPLGRFAVALDGARTDAAAVVGADLLADGRLAFVTGDPATALPALDAGGAAIVPRSLAERGEITLGSTLALLSGTGSVELEVVAIVERTIPGTVAEAILVGWPDAAGRLGVLGADAFAVRFEPGQEESAVAGVEDTARAYALEPATLDEAAGAIGATVDRRAALFAALAAVAVMVAVLGIVNTLAMNVLERVRELALLRATGLTSSQAWRLVVLEAAILGLVGALLGALAGLAAGAALVLLAGGAATAFQPPWLVAAAALVGGVVVAVLASLYPARLAARVEIVGSLARD